MPDWFKLNRRHYLFHRKYGAVRVDNVTYPNGVTREELALDDGNGVQIAALTFRDELLLVDTPRYAPGLEHSIELPGGGIEGDTLFGAAQRELAEETGYGAESFKLLFARYRAPHKLSSLTTVVLALGARPLLTSELAAYVHDSGEVINQVIKMPLSQAFEEVDLSIKDLITCSTIERLEKMRGKGEI